MLISKAIAELESIREYRGDIEVQLQSDPKCPRDTIIGYEQFFILPEEYEDEWRVNIRTWPS